MDRPLESRPLLGATARGFGGLPLPAFGLLLRFPERFGNGAAYRLVDRGVDRLRLLPLRGRTAARDS